MWIDLSSTPRCYGDGNEIAGDELMATYRNSWQYAALRRKGKLRPFKVMTDAELKQSAQAMLARQGLKTSVDKSAHTGQRWSLIDGKRVEHS